MIKEVKLYETGSVSDGEFKFAVIAAGYKDEWIWCFNAKRRAWELPGGTREPGEAIGMTAERELREETGAVKFSIEPVCAYSVVRDTESFGMLYFAEVTELGGLPEFEIERIGFFKETPEGLSFPLIQPKLLEQVKRFVNKR